MAVATINTILQYKEDNAFVKLVDIKDYPDLGSLPNTIDTTDLTQTESETNILGLQSADALEFNCNYDYADMVKLETIAGSTQTFRLVLGEGGIDGVFEWTGELSVWKKGGGVNAVREMGIAISRGTALSLISGTGVNQFAYDNTGAITAVTEGAAFDDGVFSVPVGVKSFDFKDGATTFTAGYLGGAWTIKVK